MIRRLGANEITGVSINKMSNQSVYVQWADVNPTVPQYRIVLWYNGNQRVDTILSGQDAANDYFVWYVDMGTYALMPGDVIKATVTPYAGNAPAGPSYSASATIQATPQAVEPTAVQQTTPVSQPPVVQTPTTQPPTPAPTPTPVVTLPAPIAPPINQYVSTPPADTTTGAAAPSAPLFSLLSWIKSHALLSAGIVIGTGYVIHGAKKQ